MTRILSLDDDPAMVSLIHMILDLTGYDHVGVTDSHEALSLLRSQPPDLFTQDIVRGDVDGFELYQILKADAALRDIPVLFISAAVPFRPEIAAMCCVTYGDDCLAKPFSPPQLVASVAGLLRRRGKPIPTREEWTARKVRNRRG